MHALPQIIRFGFVGVTATAVHYLVALAVASVATPFLANFAGYCSAVGVSYFGHHRFTFDISKDKAAHGRRIPRFIITSLSALLLSQAVLAVAVFAGFSEPVSLAFAVLIVPPYMFVLSRIWVFSF